MSSAPRPALAELIASLTEEEITVRLTRLHAEAPFRPPILDEDDLEQAIEDAADQVVDQRRNRP